MSEYILSCGSTADLTREQMEKHLRYLWLNIYSILKNYCKKERTFFTLNSQAACQVPVTLPFWLLKNWQKNILREKSMWLTHLVPPVDMA